MSAKKKTKNTHQLHLSQERIVEKGEEEGRDDFSLPLPLFRAANHCSKGKRAEEEPCRSNRSGEEKEQEVERVLVGLV